MMATKTFCDRCGAEINLRNPMTYARLISIGCCICNDYELCASCTQELKLWLNEKKGENNE